MLWNKKRTKTIIIVLPDDAEEQHKYKHAIYKYLEEFHKDDIRKDKIMQGVLYSYPMESVEIDIYGNCDIDIYELHHYISEYTKSTDTLQSIE